VRMKAISWPVWLFFLRSFSAARQANSVMASRSSYSSVMGRPKLRVQAICCLAGGGLRIRCRGCRPVRARFFQHNGPSGFGGGRVYALHIKRGVKPCSRSWAPILRPTHQTSPTLNRYHCLIHFSCILKPIFIVDPRKRRSFIFRK
jgi:hypothetical protein